MGHEGAGERWKARPWLAGLLRAVILLTPVALSCLVTWALVSAWRPTGHRPAWIIGLSATALFVGLVSERALRRLTPLATLLRITMLFPDRAPSRMRMARTAGDSKRLVERLGSRPEHDAAAAAEQVLTLITALGNHDRRTRGHSERVRVFADLLGEELKLPERARDRLRWAALLHDVGKLRIATALLNKPDSLTADEFARIKAHPQAGAELTGPLLPWLGEWGLGIVQHHERVDGRGYPAGLVGPEISLSGRILNVVDAFETMTAARAYKKAMATRSARAELAACAGSQFDAEVVRAFLMISLPRLLLAMGPLSLLAQLPFLRSIAEAGNRGALVGAQASSVAAVAAAGALGSLAVQSSFPPAQAMPPDPRPTATSAPTERPSHHEAVLRRQHVAPQPPATDAGVRPTREEPPAPSVPGAPPTGAPAPEAPSHPVPVPPVFPPIFPPAFTPDPVLPPPAPLPPVAPVVVVGVPGRPTALVARAGDAQATVSWTAPASNGSPLTGYTVTPYVAGVAEAAVPVPATSTSVVVGGLVNGVTYTFEVAATNAVGTSPSGASGPVTPAGVPSSVSSVAAVAGDGQATVSWAAPSGNGSALTGFTVTPHVGATALAPVPVAPGSTSVVVTGLVNGTTYTFAVAAANAVGTGPSGTSGAVTPAGAPAATVPDAPGSPGATPGLLSATVAWDAPADGGAPLTSYVVRTLVGGTEVGSVTVPPTSTRTVVTGLLDGVTYTFAITAENAVGVSAQATTNAVQTATRPGKVQGLVGTPGVGEIVTSWSAPTTTGGLPLTGYRVTLFTAGGPAATVVLDASTLTHTFTGLVAGLSYNVQVVATNAAVDGTPSTTSPIRTTPAPPPAVSGASNDASATVSWSTPPGVLRIDTYTVSAFDGGTLVATTTVTAPQTTAIVPGLTNGTAYTFTVQTDTLFGSSATSAPSAPVTPAAPLPGVTVPDKPGSLGAQVGIGEVTVSWSASTAPVDGPVTSYLVSVLTEGGAPTGRTFLVDGTTTAVTLEGLTSGGKYRFRVEASNVAGTSADSTTGSVKID